MRKSPPPTPSFLFILLALICFLYSESITLIYGHSTVDINFNDTYFVIDRTHIMISLVILFFLFAAIYLPSSKTTNRSLAYLHFGLNLILAGLLLTPSLPDIPGPPTIAGLPPIKYPPHLSTFIILNISIFIILISILFAIQLPFFIHLIKAHKKS